MKAKRLYPVAKNLQNFCTILNLSPERILRRAGLPIDLIANEGKGVEARYVFALWNAIFEELGSTDVVLDMAIAYARGPFVPPLFAFSCSANIEQGLNRLALFKPLMGPIKLDVRTNENNLTFSLHPMEADHAIPVQQCLFELAFFVESCRSLTASPIVPLAIASPLLPDDIENFETYFGVALSEADHPTITLSLEDAHRPLISENKQLWAYFEKDLQKQLLQSERDTLMSLRVRNALLELLPAGQASSDAVADKLMVGKRTLQRQLKAEGKSFQQILDGTRSELSLHYLRQDDITVEEISYLLAYREPNSFYRAFQNWTGMTPLEARAQSLH